MANNTNVLSGETPCNNELMRGVKRVQGTAAREPGQRERTADSGTGTASAQNSTFRVNPLFGTAKEEPNQGARVPDSGAGGTASLAGRGTMEQK